MHEGYEGEVARDGGEGEEVCQKKIRKIKKKISKMFFIKKRKKIAKDESKVKIEEEQVPLDLFFVVTHAYTHIHATYIHIGGRVGARTGQVDGTGPPRLCRRVVSDMRVWRGQGVQQARADRACSLY